MSKAILVMEMPVSCSMCELCIPVSKPYCSAFGEKLDMQTNIRENQRLKTE